MSEGDKGEKMDKKSNQRQTSAVQRNFNEVSRNQRSARRRGNGSGGGNFSYNEGPSRKPTPQKYRNTWDRRPRPRTDANGKGRGDLEEDGDLAEYGSAFQTGSKKGNLNHLLNFTFEQRETAFNAYRGSGGAGWTRARNFKYKGGYFRGSKVYYNKETYLQANCQFLVKKDGDYHVHLMDPDVLVDWDCVEQIRVTNSEEQSCPICLEYPVAAKMTRCGHIYCWPCILHYLALGEKSWRKCPICYESIHSDDLKSVNIRQVNNYKVGDTITMTLMKKEKGSLYAVPVTSWQKQPETCHNITDPKEITCHQKLLSVTPQQVLDILETERDYLTVHQVDAEASEEPFIKGALEQLQAREMKLKGIFQSQPEKEDTAKPRKEKETQNKTTVKQQGKKKNKNIKQYKDAFDDEEEAVNRTLSQSTSSDFLHSQISSEDSSPLTEGGPLTPESPREEASQVNPAVEQSDENTGSSTPSSPTDQGACLVGSPDIKAPPLGMVVDGMPVEEAAEHLELPSQGEHTDRSRNMSGDKCFYFYQAEDGQHVYLHALNAKCLVKEYGSLQNSPTTITGEIVEKESGFVSDELRKRLRYLSHLPVTCSFDVTELILKPPTVSKDTLKHFSDDIDRRRRNRQKRSRDEKRIARKIEEHEKKQMGLSTGFCIKSDFHQSGDRLSDTRSDTSSPLLDTPVGSPQGLNVNAAEFTPSGGVSSSTEVEDGSQTSVVSFAQMIKGGSHTTKWPKVKSSTPRETRVRQNSSSQPRGSDESDNEDRVPVPQFQQSFGSDIQAVLQSIEKKSPAPQQQSASGSSNPAGTPSNSGKKKKKQLVLFSTSMARGGN